jgi:hypothetical protein
MLQVDNYNIFIKIFTLQNFHQYIAIRILKLVFKTIMHNYVLLYAI